MDIPFKMKRLKTEGISVLSHRKERLNLHEFGEPVSPALKLVRLHTQGQLKDFLLTSKWMAGVG